MTEVALADRKTEKEIEKMDVEIDKLRAETRKILRETLVVPFLAGAACATGIAAVVGVLLSVVGKLPH